MSKLSRIDPDSLATNPRASLASWLRYSHIVEAAFAQRPRPYSYTPTNFTPATVASQLRDALRGCIAFAYPTTIESITLSSWFDSICITHDATSIHIGPKKKKELEKAEGTNPLPDAFSFVSLTLSEFSAFELLLDSGRLRGPIRIKTPPDFSMIPEKTNVTRVVRPDGSLILL